MLVVYVAFIVSSYTTDDDTATKGIVEISNESREDEEPTVKVFIHISTLTES